MPRMRCGRCHEIFTSSRNDAVYCSPKCRVSANRAGEMHKPDSLDPVRETVAAEPLKNRRCGYCAHWFLPRRRDATFCCAKCRVYAFRQKGKTKVTVTVKRGGRNNVDLCGLPLAAYILTFISEFDGKPSTEIVKASCSLHVPPEIAVRTFIKRRPKTHIKYDLRDKRDKGERIVVSECLARLKSSKRAFCDSDGLWEVSRR